MANIKYKLEFFSYWHCGSGLAKGADVDQLVVKDEYGLPFVPGKTIKGLVREAAENINALSSKGYNTDSIFGKCDNDGSSQGLSFFSNAEFPESDKLTIINEKLKMYLFSTVSSTAIGDDGIAKEHSLRKTEVALPCILTGYVLNVPEDGIELIKNSFRFIKRLGENRNRGLGRCEFTIIE